MIKRFFILAAAAVLLTACGGGSSDEPPAPTNSAEGLWISSPTDIPDVTSGTLILADGKTWSLTLYQDNLIGMQRGQTTWDATTFAGNLTNYSLTDGTREAVTFSGAYHPKSDFSLTAQPSGVSSTGTYHPSYDQPPVSLADLAGTFEDDVQARTTDGDDMPGAYVEVFADGQFALRSFTCIVEGSLSHSPSGKNFFDLSISATYGPYCDFTGLAMTGFVVHRSDEGYPMLIGGALAADGSWGFAFKADRRAPV